jgi:hypothetical protein
MAKHRTSETRHLNPLIGGALLAGGLMMAAAPIASADTGVNGRPSSGPAAQPGVDAIQTAGDSVFDNPNANVPSLSVFGGPVPLSNTSVGKTYHALYGNSSVSRQTDGDGNPIQSRQGLTLGVVNSFATGYNIQCNLVVQTACGTP